MASVSDRVYFPPLEDCLFGERLLLSWKHVATALSDVSGQRQKSPTVIDFFDDDYVHQLLKSPSDVFAPPSDATQKNYETRTAPINVTSADSERVDIKIIKEDAQWLSKNVKINLVAALRIVIVEFQSRSSRYLLGPLSSQDATNLQEAAGLASGNGMSLLSELGAATATDAEQILADFETVDARKKRLVETYFEERRNFMMVADYAHSIKLYGQLPIFTRVDRKLSQLYRLSSPTQAKDEIETLLPAYMKVLSDSLESLDGGLQSLTDDQVVLVDDLELDWVFTVLTETVHGMSVILQLADCNDLDYAPSGTVHQWFALMETYSFFYNIQAIDGRIAELTRPLRTLAATVSLALLKPAQSMAHLIERENEPAQVSDIHDSYLFSSEVLEQIHSAVVAAANVDCLPAYPVILAWCHILHQMSLSYQERTEKRDTLMLQNARDKFEAGTEATAGTAVRPVMGRRNSAGSVFSIESSRFDVFLEQAALSKDMTIVRQLAEIVTAQYRVHNLMSDMAVDDSLSPLIGARARATFLEMLKVTFPTVGYEAEPVNALVSLLTANWGYWDINDWQSLPPEQDIRSAMLHDSDLLEVYLNQALNGFPLEFLPFITLCRILCSAPTAADDDYHSTLILQLLQNTPTLTLGLPESFNGYELGIEDETVNSMCLIEDLPLVSLSSAWRRKQPDDDSCCIPAGTPGRFLTPAGSATRFVRLDYAHSTLALLGRRLEINLMPQGYHSEIGFLQPDEVVETIALYATLIRVEFVKAHKANTTDTSADLIGGIIADASQYITGGRDLITIICETMDSYLQDELAVNDGVAVDVLNSCIQFFDAILPEYPSRVWSYLARCDLLSSESKAGRLGKIVGTLDLVAGRYEFLNSSIHLFNNMIETSTTAAVQHRMGSKATTGRRQDQNIWAGVSGKVLSKVLSSIAVASVDVFENTSTWKFQSEDQRTSLTNDVVLILNKIIKYAFGTGDPRSSNSLTSSLRPAAIYVLDCFLEPVTGTLRFQPVLTSLITNLANPLSTLYPLRRETRRNQISNILELLTVLLRISNLLEKSDKAAPMMEAYLFKISTLLVRVCAVSDEYLTPATVLFDALVFNAGKSESEPLSLLGYLGPQTSKSFLQLLSALGRPFLLAPEARSIWKLFSSILRNRQQWMSNCLLTGKTPREVMKKEVTEKKELASNSIFSIALAKLSKLKDMDAEQALAILDFVASAQNYWPWTIFTLQKDTSYLDGLQAYVQELKPSQLITKTNTTKAAVEARIAAYIGETFAMQLYHSRHLGNADALAKKLVTGLDYYLRDGVEVAGYNKSLHTNFSKNFDKKYSGCSLSDFQKTLLEPRQLGASFYYDIDLANRMLSFDPGWLGRKDNGFKFEMELANANLSLVDAQIALFHAWEFLLLELSASLGTNETISKQMLQVAQQCLNSNQAAPGPETIFLKVTDTRAHLALILIQRLAKLQLHSADVYDLLSTVVGTIHGVEEPFSSENIAYYRTLLKTLFVTLRAQQKSSSGSAVDSEAGGSVSVDVAQVVLNILDRVVGRGFRSLVSLIHEHEAAVSPEDLALLTAILQACLSLPTIDQSQNQILNIMASHNCIYAATSLFSWADKLATQGDPVYGELSVLFLLELSALPLLAEQMACDGVLSSLLSANLTKYMLKTNVSPYSEAPMSQRCYSIWAKGLLPIMLNLLTALGATVAPEVAYVLNQFTHFLHLSIDRFEAPGASRTETRSAPHYITLIAVSEINSLALLTCVLSALRLNSNQNIPSVDWDAGAVLENVEFWLSSDKILKERLLPLGSRELEWRGMKVPGKGGNVLEDKLISQLEAVRDVLREEVDDE